MRKWMPFAPPRARAWHACLGFIPTPVGTYRTNDVWVSHATGPTATATRLWCALLPNGVVGYLGTTTKLYEYDGSTTFTDRSKGGATYTSTTRAWNFVQYGDITIASNRADAVQYRDATTTNNFADLAGAPKATILVSQAEQVLAFDINDGAEKRDAFATSAPGDYTDWSSANATTATRIRHRPGRITAATAFRDYVLVFKADSIYKLTYTGNATYKWRVECIAVGRGASNTWDVVNCGDEVVFTGKTGSWRFDGSSFRRIDDGFYKNLGDFVSHVFCPLSRNVWFLANSSGQAYVYNLDSDAWGLALGRDSGNYIQLMGEPTALATFQAVLGFAPAAAGKPDLHFIVSTGGTCTVYRNSSAFGAGSSSLSASISGNMEGLGGYDAEGREKMTAFTRVNVEYSDSFSGALTPAAVGEAQMFGSLYDVEEWDAPSGSITTVTSSTAAKHFDIRQTARYARFQLTANADTGHIEIADWTPGMLPAGVF